MLSPTPTPPTARAVSEVLEAAALLIEPEGKWTQGTWGSLETCMCMEGAVYAAAGAHPMAKDASADRAVALLVKMLPSDPGNPIAAWNDAPDRTQAEVVAALRSAATLARETEAGS